MLTGFHLFFYLISHLVYSLSLSFLLSFLSISLLFFSPPSLDPLFLSLLLHLFSLLLFPNLYLNCFLSPSFSFTHMRSHLFIHYICKQISLGHVNSYCPCGMQLWCLTWRRRATFPRRSSVRVWAHSSAEEPTAQQMWYNFWTSNNLDLPIHFFYFIEMRWV